MDAGTEKVLSRDTPCMGFPVLWGISLSLVSCCGTFATIASTCITRHSVAKLIVTDASPFTVGELPVACGLTRNDKELQVHENCLRTVMKK